MVWLFLLDMLAGRLLEENNFQRKNFNLYTKLSKHKGEVLHLLTLGKSAADLVAYLSISYNTVETHAENIKQRLGTGSLYLCEYARAFDLR